MSIGLNDGGTIYDSLGEHTINSGLDLRTELLLKLNSFCFLGIGTGYKSLSLVDGELVYGLDAWERFYDMQPTVRIHVVPLFASIQLKGNVASWARVYVTGGIGAYFGLLDAEAEWIVEPEVLNLFTRRSRYRADMKALTAHLGGGLEFTLGEVFHLFLEALYNPVTFSNFDDWEEQTKTGLNPYIPDTGEFVFPSDFVYEISEISFSGLSLNLGVGVVF
jgi:hypothetical protein